MKIHTVIVAGNAPAGARLWLTGKQADARDRLLALIGKSTSRDRRLYELRAPAGFKAGEELGVEGDLDAGFRRLFGLDQDKPPTPVAPPEHKPGRNALATAQKQLEEAGTAAAVAQKALQDAATDEEKTAAREKLDAAQQAVAEAEAAVKAAS